MFKSALTLAALAATVLAESSCPATTTSTAHETYTYLDLSVETETVTDSESTYTPSTSVYTATNTYTDATSTVTECANTVTKNIEFTSTSYTGDYTSSALRTLTSCAPVKEIVEKHPGTTYSTRTTTVTEPVATANSTRTVLTNDYTIITADMVSTYTAGCTDTVTSTTATASSTTVTQNAKCAPTNLIGTDGIAGQRYRGSPLDGIANYGSGAGGSFNESADKDASSCCQVCQDEENCAASIYVASPQGGQGSHEPFCQLFNKNQQSYEEGCGLGFSIFPGDKKIAQSGSCGYVAEHVYADGVCFEGDSARECASYAGYRRP